MPAAPEYQPAALRALDYLETTHDEMGIDVVVATQIYGALTGDPRGDEVAEARRPTLRASDVELFGVVLEIEKPPFPPASLDGIAVNAPPNPDDVLDDRVASCPEEILGCVVSSECREFVELDDRGGYVLTHQALWLLFHAWLGCTSDVDVEARRRTFGARIAREIAADPMVSDLYAERLAMLGHLGFGSAIREEWMDPLIAAQQPEGCFPVSDTVLCHPHPTGLALWAIAHTGEW